MEELVSLDEEGNSAKRRKLSLPSASGDESEAAVQDSEKHCDSDFSASEDEAKEFEDEKLLSDSDPHAAHFGYKLPEGQPTDKLQYEPSQQHEFEELGSMAHYRTHLLPSSGNPPVGESTLSELGLKKNLLGSLRGSDELTPFQINFLHLMSNYYDISYMQRTYRKGEALRKVYTLHILNHILKSRSKIIHHNSKLVRSPDAEFRDQGFTRPTAVVLAPFRHDAHRIVQCITQLLPPECVISNKKRFEKEYGPPPKRHRLKKKPQDYEHTFEGNVDEDFKIGLSIKNKSVTLYSEFYRSDLLIASPLGLRQVLGAEGDTDCDFLSSVEILVVERVDILYLQNLVHLMHVLRQFNLLPRQSHGCDFSRVRAYACDGLARMYRQTLLLTSVEHRWFESVLLRNYCSNYKGYLCSVTKPKSLGVSQVFVTLKMCFRFFEFSDPAKEFDDRFTFFVEKVLPDFCAPETSQTLIYVPSYFDFVRLRNHFREKELSATMICEYSSTGKVAEARNNFFKERRHFMLYTERAHFYNRYSLKGIQHLLFYQLPTYPAFFRDLQFALLDSNPRRQHEERSCTVLASTLDLLQLKQLVGPSRARRMVSSKEKVFVQQILR